jgi:hypothetical protein
MDMTKGPSRPKMLIDAKKSKKLIALCIHRRRQETDEKMENLCLR